MLIMNHILKKKNSIFIEVDHTAPLLEVKNLSLSFRQFRRGLKETTIKVIRNLDLTINSREIFAVVGASGSGKSLLANSILGLLPRNAISSGSIRFMGKELTEDMLQQVRGKHISLIPQSIHALNPLLRTGKQVVAEHSKRSAIFQRLHLPIETANFYPFELSGGMARRVMVASAFAGSAELIIADEPTPGLDPRALSDTANYFKELANNGRGIMFITHDIETALLIADRIAVFYAGEVVEITNAKNFSGKGEGLRHPYTKALWNALPQNGFTPLKGNQPYADEMPSGCIFQPRCPIAAKNCLYEQPETKYSSEEMVRCFYA